MKSLPNLAGRLLLIAGGLLLPLLILEIGVRVVGLAPPPVPNPAIWEPHPLFGWWHIPHSGGIFHSDYNEFEAEVRINARGLRDREIGYDNPTGALRILSLADSFGEALQIDLVDTYPKQLERLLADSLGQPVEVINAGVGGWGTDQEAIFYVAEGFRYQPNVVLLAFFIRNDALNSYGPLEIARNGGSRQKEFFTLADDGQLIPPPVQESDAQTKAEQTGFQAGLQQPLGHKPALLGLSDALWRVSDLYRLLVPYLRDIPPVVQRLGPSGILGGEGVVRAGHPSAPLPFFVYQSPPNQDFVAAWTLTEAILAQLQTEVEKRGARLVVVIIGAPEQVYPEAWQRTLTANPAMQSFSWNLDAPNRRLAGFLTEQGIPYLDLLPVFREAAARPDSPPLHFRHDQHWTEAGHRLAAEEIYDFLLPEIEKGVAE
ncbi:MAG: SGNH/GDSL hydrolase family protein [Anaerolineae bacterium]|nr:SGNH/GDSL hydrolase family protein [Anaerolineae bacterium]